MFGALKTWGCGWNADERDEWVGHVCGTCVALGAHCGASARLATNYDAALVLAFCEAQSAEPLPRRAHFCPLRGFSTADVVEPSAAAARYAASLSTLMAATKVEDHVADGDGWIRHVPTLAGAWAKRLKEGSRRLAADLGFDTGGVEGPVARQAEVEKTAGDFLFYARPTEEAGAAVLAETAAIAGRPENRGVLAEVGALYGRLIYLLDSFRDLEEDRRAKRFNALRASYEPAEIGERAVALFQDAAEKIRRLLPRLELRRPEIVERLLVHELRHVGRRTLAPVGGLAFAGDAGVLAMSSEYPNDHERREHKKKGLCRWCDCCDCCDCCVDNNCDCCDCDCCCPCD